MVQPCPNSCASGEGASGWVRIRGASGQGDARSGLQSRPWSQLSKEKWRDVLSKMSCCCPAVFCGRPSVHYNHISHSKKKGKKGLPGLLNVEYAAHVGKCQEAQLLLLIPSACCFSVKKNTIIPIPIPSQSYIPFRTHFSLLPKWPTLPCRCISGE